MATAQSEPNYDENKVPHFEVPELLTSFQGKPIDNTKKWIRKRRPELLRFFENRVFGKVPKTLNEFSAQVLEQSDHALNGKAKRKQVQLTFTRKGKTLRYTLLIYTPKQLNKAPMFLGYNFYGNHTVGFDKNIIISKAWARNNENYGIIDNKLNEKSRGVRSSRWAIEKIIDGGFGFATLYYGEVDPDKNDLSDGVHRLFYKKHQEKPKKNEWGSISAWAWGLSRALDYCYQDPEIDASKVIVFGHSRLGKTSLWAAATDIRFAGAISNNSGCGGAALSKRRYGETIAVINTQFPHWFCTNFKAYNNKEDVLPIDQHQLLALIAPRPLYVASAQEDRWADPHGEFLSAYHATPTYTLFGKEGIPTSKLPNTNEPILNTLSYHIRTGGHDVTEYDWEQYIRWAQKEVVNTKNQGGD